MPSLKTWLFLALGATAVFYVATFARGLRFAARSGPVAPTPLQLLIGAVTNFFDTLGIGSFATTTSFFKLRRLVDDRLIPGTLNVGHTPPTIAQAFIYIALVEVDAVTLVLLIGASVLGAWLGAGIVAGWSRRKVQVGMGLCLLGMATLMLLQALQIAPGGGEALGLGGAALVIGLVGNFTLGALMTLGIGLYAPCLIMISLLGMNPKAAFPIMMGACAFLMPTASARFVAKQSYHPQASLGLALGGIPAVLVAAFIVKSLPIQTVRGMVIAVVVYTAYALLRSAWTERSPATEAAAQA